MTFIAFVAVTRFKTSEIVGKTEVAIVLSDDAAMVVELTPGGIGNHDRIWACTGGGGGVQMATAGKGRSVEAEFQQMASGVELSLR